ncbi:hypothetical protein ACS15_0061 [Ralstonia insidiosa]|uniref:Uncharacterized protein n=1 Tax=Ralstonia insidiosa TaxID=190721 RepID=A0AAC9FRQ3_9RALS|nr:hypothetical protein ACS15_0061 [Ralstonia insidiosa]
MDCLTPLKKGTAASLRLASASSCDAAVYSRSGCGLAMTR